MDKINEVIIALNVNSAKNGHRKLYLLSRQEEALTSNKFKSLFILEIC